MVGSKFDELTFPLKFNDRLTKQKLDLTATDQSETGKLRVESEEDESSPARKEGSTKKMQHTGMDGDRE